MKGYIVRNSQQTIFVKSIATEEEIEFIKEKYGKSIYKRVKKGATKIAFQYIKLMIFPK